MRSIRFQGMPEEQAANETRSEIRCDRDSQNAQGHEYAVPFPQIQDRHGKLASREEEKDAQGRHGDESEDGQGVISEEDGEQDQNDADHEIGACGARTEPVVGRQAARAMAERHAA